VKKLTAKDLKKKGFPQVLIPGLLVAAALGFKGVTLLKDYYQNKQIFPDSGYVQQVEDGDTFVLKNSRTIRLIGINAPERGEKNYTETSNYLINHLSNQRVYLEYNRYQDDPYGRILAWVWIGCEQTPKLY